MAPRDTRLVEKMATLAPVAGHGANEGSNFLIFYLPLATKLFHLQGPKSPFFQPAYWPSVSKYVQPRIEGEGVIKGFIREICRTKDMQYLLKLILAKRIVSWWDRKNYP